MKKNIKFIIAFILGFISSAGAIVYATIAISAEDVIHKDVSLKEALDDLYHISKSFSGESCADHLNEIFNYNNGTKTFIVPCTGTYKIEAWGAQGQNSGGYGGYSVGYTKLNRSSKLYLAVGSSSGFNGGGQSSSQGGGYSGGAGGGATHVATSLLGQGLLSDYANAQDKILLVAGGGGGSAVGTNDNTRGIGGSAGGFVGNNGTGANDTDRKPGTGGTQEESGISGSSSYSTFTESGFGQGCQANSSYSSYMRVSGGGGWYGGGCGMHSGGGGGSSYINTSILTNAEMYCYNCTESSELKTKTITSMSAETDPVSNTPKKGNGHIRITFISVN